MLQTVFTGENDSCKLYFLMGKYCHNSSFSTVSHGTSSHGWKGILWGQDLLLNHLGKSIDNGESTRVWQDSWILSTPALKPQGPMQERDQDLMVSDLLSRETKEWNSNLITEASRSCSTISFWSNLASLGLRMPTSGPQTNLARTQCNQATTRYIILLLTPQSHSRASSLHHRPPQIPVREFLLLLFTVLSWILIGKRTFGTYLCLQNWSSSSWKQLKIRSPQELIYNVETLLKQLTACTAMVTRPPFTPYFFVLLPAGLELGTVEWAIGLF